MVFTITSDTRYECSIYGKFSNEEYNKIREVISAMCGDYYKEIRQHELLLFPTVTTPIGPERADDVPLRLRNSYLGRYHPKRSNRWQYVVQGTPEANVDRPVNVRPIQTSMVKGNFSKFFLALGYSNYLEVAKEGFCYFFNENIMISIYKLYKLGRRFNISTLYNIDSRKHDNWIIEVHSIPCQSDQVDLICGQILEIQDCLSDIIELDYIDHLILDTKIHYRHVDYELRRVE